jgi:hypothetical protein
MPLTNEDLDKWLDRLQKCKSRPELFQLLDEFRPLEWSDEQRAVMAKAYMLLLENRLKQQPSDTAVADKKGGPDGPVWYEKM